MDGGVIRIVIPGVPKALERARHRLVTPRARKPFVATYTPAQTRSEQGAIKLFAQRAMEGRAPIEGPVDFRFTAFLPVPASWSQRKRAAALAGEILPVSRPDLDNYAKMKDALKEIVWRDDSQVTDEHLWKRYSDQPRIVMEIRPLAPGAGSAA